MAETDLRLTLVRIICTDTSWGAVADVTRQDLLLPPTRTFAQSSDKSSHIRSSVSFTMFLYCHSLTQTDISKETPCSTFISPWENHSATKFIKRRATLITDRLLLSLSRPLLFWSIHSTPFVSPYSIFLRCPCPDSSSQRHCFAHSATSYP